MDEKYYVSNAALKGFEEHAKKQKEKGNSFHAVFKDVYDAAPTIKSRYYKDGSDCLIRTHIVGRINSSQDGKIMSVNGIMAAHTAGHSNAPKILERTIVASRGRNPNNPSDRTTGTTTEQRLEPNMQGICNCLTSVQKDNLVMEEHIIQRSNQQYRIRKLTPRECGRLMGVSDEDISKMEKVNSNTQLYKQFGNSIVVDVMCAMFKSLNINQ